MIKRRVAMVAVAGLAASLLAACSSTAGDAGDGGPTAGDAGDGGPTELRFATPDSGPGAEYLQSVVDAYNESQDDVVIKMEAYGDAFDQKLSSQIGSGGVPDILKIWNFPAYNSILAPLNDYIDGLPDKDDFFETLFNYSEMDGNIYGFPTGYSTRAFYYNTDLAERAGLTPSPDWTSEDYVEWVTKIGGLGDNIMGGDQFINPDPYAFESFLFSNGGEWLNDAGEPVVNSPENLEVIEFLHSVAYGAETGDVVRKHPASEDTSAVFMAGDLGTFEFGKWFAQTFTDNATPYGILPMFSFNGNTPKSVVHAGFITISKDTEHMEEALDFITWMSTPENVTAAAAYDLPIRKSVSEELGLTTDPISGPFLQMLENSVDTKTSMLKNEDWPDISAEIGATLEAIFANENPDIAAELDDLQAKLESL
ncbi:MAG TPA: sugar ABC transporter substrate-binding protein [Coriobacteriia bacterium]|nr:sugar ABC transporter substrate-binding protein [Coriobacteriia bacterium]